MGAALLSAYTISGTVVPSAIGFELTFGIGAGVALVGVALALFVTGMSSRVRGRVVAIAETNRWSQSGRLLRMRQEADCPRSVRAGDQLHDGPRLTSIRGSSARVSLKCAPSCRRSSVCLGRHNSVSGLGRAHDSRPPDEIVQYEHLNHPLLPFAMKSLFHAIHAPIGIVSVLDVDDLIIDHIGPQRIIPHHDQLNFLRELILLLKIIDQTHEVDLKFDVP